MAEQISSHQLGKFLKHLCLVTKHYYDRETARKGVDRQLDKISKAGMDDEVARLNRKIDLLIEKEANVANLGTSYTPITTLKRIKHLEMENSALKEEKEDMIRENKELKKVLEALTNLQSGIREVQDKKIEVEQRVGKLNKVVNRKYRQFLINEIKDKISELTERHKILATDESVDPARLHLIEEKMQYYREKLKKL